MPSHKRSYEIILASEIIRPVPPAKKKCTISKKQTHSGADILHIHDINVCKTGNKSGLQSQHQYPMHVQGISPQENQETERQIDN